MMMERNYYEAENLLR